jgi:hypothetical protein
MSNGMKIDEDQFRKLPVEEQRVVMYRALMKQFEHCDGRFKKIEGRKLVSAGASAGGGIIGGFLAMILKLAFWK